MPKVYLTSVSVNQVEPDEEQGSSSSQEYSFLDLNGTLLWRPIEEIQNFIEAQENANSIDCSYDTGASTKIKATGGGTYIMLDPDYVIT